MGIGIRDWGLGLVIEDWGLGIGDWKLVLEIWIRDWYWVFGSDIEIEIRD